MENVQNATQTDSTTVLITPAQLLNHWQGHRRLTRRVLEAFPEDKLFTYSVGGMRPFSELIIEMLGMGIPSVKGVLTGQWEQFDYELKERLKTRQDLLNAWDETTEQLNTLFPQIAIHRFQEVELAFGMYEGPVHWLMLYIIDNEIHHRAQGYVYLRSLGIEPPAFWDRS
jgi:uncharacterized damage-inducible protein DinB